MHTPGDFFLILRVSGKCYKVFDSERAVIFIDGNNLYHGVDRLGIGQSSMDINYDRLSEKLVDGRKWTGTRFYIGKVPKEYNLEAHRNQLQLISDFEKCDRIQHYFGRLEKRRVHDSVSKHIKKWLNNLPGRDNISVNDNAIVELRQIIDHQKTWLVEKAVDVMIATDMVSMAYEDKYDVAYLLSADSDFTPAIEKVRESGRKVFVASADPANQLSKVATGHIPLNEGFLDGCWK